MAHRPTIRIQTVRDWNIPVAHSAIAELMVAAILLSSKKSVPLVLSRAALAMLHLQPDKEVTMMGA